VDNFIDRTFDFWKSDIPTLGIENWNKKCRPILFRIGLWEIYFEFEVTGIISLVRVLDIRISASIQNIGNFNSGYSELLKFELRIRILILICRISNCRKQKLIVRIKVNSACRLFVQLVLLLKNHCAANTFIPVECWDVSVYSK
jgi:hypothetical protein